MKNTYSQSYDFFSSHVWMWELDHKEGWMLKNWCFWAVVLQKTLESPLDSKETKPINPKESTQNIHWKDWCWSWSSNTLATWCEELTYWESPWCWERLKAGGKGDNRGWGGWMTSTQWMWVWASCGRQQKRGKPGVLQSMGLQRVGPNWVTEQLLWKLLQATLYLLPFKLSLITVHCCSENLQWLCASRPLVYNECILHRSR